MPGWKRDVGRSVDAVIVRNVPSVRKAVKWNSPFYGIEGQGWFANFHCFTKYVKVAFFRGTSLRPALGLTLEAHWLERAHENRLLGSRRLGIADAQAVGAQLARRPRRAAPAPCS